PALQEEEDHHDDDEDGLRQRLQDFPDGFADGASGIEGHGVFQAGREAPGEPFYLGSHIAVDIERVGVGELKHAQAHGIHAVVTKLPTVTSGSQFGSTNVPQLDEGTVCGTLDHDALKIPGLGQTSHGTYADLVSLAARRGWLPH